MSPELDREEMLLRLQKLKENIRILKNLQKITLHQLENDPVLKGAVLHYSQLSAQVCIDIGEMIIAAENFEFAGEYAQIFKILGKEKVLPRNFAETFSMVARFRNLLVHEYTKIDLKKVYHYLQNDLDQFQKFAAAIVKYMKK